MTLMSRTPASDICSVRGIGVADIEITSTRSFSWRSSSFCLTPKRCSSSTMIRPRSLGRTSRDSSRCVPMRMSSLPSLKRLTASFCSAAGPEARHLLDGHRVVRQALGEGPEVLLGEDRRRHQHQHLLAALDRLERGAQRDLGLAVADVAADQAVHRARGLHVGLDHLDRLALVGGLGVGELRLELDQPVAVGRVGVAAAALALGVQVQQLAGHLLGGAAGARLERVPARAAELGQRRVVAAGADVARDLRQLVGGDEDAVLAGVLEQQVVAGDAGHRARVEPGEAGDAVVLVDDDVAGAQVGEGAQGAAAAAARTIRPVGLRAPAAHEPVLGDDGQVQRGRDEAVAQRGGGELQRGHSFPARHRSARRRSGGRGCSRRARPRRAATRPRRCGSRSGSASPARTRPP